MNVAPTATPRFAPIPGGGRLLLYAAGGALIGWIGCFVGFAVDTRQSLFSYLVAFAFFLGISLGALIWLAVFQATGTRWIVVLRRFLEIMAVVVLVFVILFLPIAIGVKVLYPWVAPDRSQGAEFLALMNHKHAWLNVPFFLLRSIGYLGLWAVLAHLLYFGSRRQDSTGDLLLALRNRRVGAVAIPLVSLSLAFASFDWFMSLQPTWYSTMYGVYYFSGGFMAALCVLILCARFAVERGVLPSGIVGPAHFHSLGKLLFAFICFWAYIGFSQYMLIWIANLPEETSYFSLRRERGYHGVFLFLILFHFVLPFLVLLSRDLKRDPRRLSYAAIYMLVAHWVDTYWLIMPYRGPGAMIHWQDVAAFLAVGGTVLVAALLRHRGVAPVPLGDPYLRESIAYER